MVMGLLTNLCFDASFLSKSNSENFKNHDIGNSPFGDLKSWTHLMFIASLLMDKYLEFHELISIV